MWNSNTLTLFISPRVSHAIRAVEYVRMSTEHQQYSTENQRYVIRQFLRQGLLVYVPLLPRFL